jgi:8-oxo-dGTP diphosphatase
VSSSVIEAAGVVLVRPSPRGPEVAVVHRPHRSDWSLPKGKLDRGERHEIAAVREAFEETGVRCVLGPSLGGRRYEVDGVPKHVRYWRATVLEQEPREPDAEVDEVRWLRRKAAKALLTYADDRALVDLALAMPDTTATIVLRHAEAMKRAVWRETGDPLATEDASRPLNDDGVEQAYRLVDLLAAFGPRLVVSSDARRCRATVEPYADHAGLDVVLEHDLSEEGCADDPRRTAAAVGRLLEHRGPAVWCSHRPVLPIALRAVAREMGLGGKHWDEALDPRLKPGAAIVLHREAEGGVVAADRLEA